MRLRQISLTTSRTINLGNYESLRLEAGAVIEFEDGETPDPAAARATAIEEIHAGLNEQQKHFRPRGR